MTKTLDVYFHGNLAGELIQDQYGDISFTYANSWLENPNAIKISCSLPLQKETFPKKICGAFFNGILPEEQSRELIAKNLGISGNNDFSMLEKIGGECAGALSFIKAGSHFDTKDNHYLKLEGGPLLKQRCIDVFKN
ncbi:MAG: HipA N-terminal domain-containing protein [Gammaproteobacteria bacterium]